MSTQRVSEVQEIETDIDVQLTDEMIRIMVERFRVPANILRYLSLCEGYRYEDIVNGNEEPKHPVSPMHAFVAVLNTYVCTYFTHKSKKGNNSPLKKLNQRMLVIHMCAI
jgi:hypothetical protein